MTKKKSTKIEMVAMVNKHGDARLVYPEDVKHRRGIGWKSPPKPKTK